MKPLLRWAVAVVVITGWAAGMAQSSPDASAEQARIVSERAQAEAEFIREEKNCRARFSVTECVADARRHRRERLADLHRQEVSLNDARRLQQAVDRANAVDERSSAQRQQADADRRARALEDDLARRRRASQRVAGRTEPASATNARSAEHAAPGSNAKSPRSNSSQEFQKKQNDAAVHKSEVQKRLDEKARSRPALPTPP